MCEHKEAKNFVITKIVISLVLFGLGYLFKPLFLVAYLVIGYDVLLRAFKNIIKGHVFDENFLMSLATVGAICIKEYPEAVMVMLLYQIGEYLQEKAVEKSRASITSLMDIRPDYANLNGEKISPEQVKIGDIITVRTGEKIPLDGVVVEGKASLNTSALTGESLPRLVNVGDEVISGCINMDGLLEVRVTKPFEDSTVAKILELVENASAKKAKTENFITKFARYYTPAVVIIAVIIALIPPFYIERALTFLVISCPCALVISIPLSFFAGIGGASKKGILIKGSNYLEQLANTSDAVFDKTGTLTKGNFKVTKVVSDYPDFLKYTAAAESVSPHPIAAAIREYYGKALPKLNDVQEFAGLGVKAVVEGKEVAVGNAKLVNTAPIKEYGTVVYTAINGKFAGYIVIADEVKPDSASTISDLRKLGVKAEMLTGDSASNAQNVAKTLDIDEVHAELLPEDKINYLEKIINNSKGSVIFVGDGINDAPVLTRADVGIAMGSLGSDAAIEAADVVIMDDSPKKVTIAIKTAKKTISIVKQNIVFAIGVKILFLILGGFGMITMWGAVFADVGVSIIAILNALRGMK